MIAKANLAELEQIAQDTFSPAKFIRVPDVCVFGEHETQDRKGKPQKYDKAALDAICARCNERILDTGDFATLVDGHTPSRAELLQGARMPVVVGFAGPFRVKKFGRVRSRWGIFTDEFHFKDDHDSLVKRPRRSVELWMSDDMAKRFFDPIACLGAETPRLDLGVRFCRLVSGETVEKYTAVAPSAGSTFVQAFKGSDEEQDQYEGDQTMLAPDEIQQIVAAINELDFVQWARQKMSEEEAAAEKDESLEDAGEGIGGGPSPTGVEAAMGGEGEAEMTGEPEGVLPAEATVAPKPPLVAAVAPATGTPVEEEDYACKPKKEDKVKMAKKTPDTDRENYAKLRVDHDQLSEKYAKLVVDNQAKDDRITALEKDASDGRRSAIIERLVNTYAIDGEAERGLCLYSMESDERKETMTDEQFNAHVSTIEKYATPSAVGAPTLPAGELPEESDKQEAEKYQRALDYADVQRKQGKDITWAQAEAWVEANPKG